MTGLEYCPKEVGHHPEGNGGDSADLGVEERFAWIRALDQYFCGIL